MSPVRARLTKLHQKLTFVGIDGTKTIATLTGMGQFRRDRREYERQRKASSDPQAFPITELWPILEDRHEQAGEASGHYFHQDLCVAREIFRRQPKRHIDVGSSIYGFVSHVASFREVEVIDIRPITSTVSGITFLQGDLMKLDDRFRCSTDSLSCLHALEHMGLGRYTDPIDYGGWRRALYALIEMLEPDGVLYLSVPTGREQRVEFHAHRVFSLPYLRDELSNFLRIESLRFVNDHGVLLEDLDPYSVEADASFGATYGCSIWTLRKPSARDDPD